MHPSIVASSVGKLSYFVGILGELFYKSGGVMLMVIVTPFEGQDQGGA